MRFSHLVKIEPILVRPVDAADMVGSAQLFDEMVKAGWIYPVMKRHKLTLYSVDNVRQCAAKLINGHELPTPEAQAIADAVGPKAE
jgi:hypothetical protein